MMTGPRKRPQLYLTSAMAAALLSLPACTSPKNEWEEVKADQDTAICTNAEGVRVADSNCANPTRAHSGPGIGSAFLLYYLGRNMRVPFLGDRVQETNRPGQGSFVPRQGASYARAPATSNITRSQAVSRGGLGARSSYFGSGRS